MEDNIPVESPNKFKAWLRKNAQILYGFFGWYIVNGIFWYSALGGRLELDPSGQGGLFFLIFTFVPNLLLFIILSVVKQTHKIALGILTALALNFILSVVSGVLIYGMCFVPFYMR